MKKISMLCALCSVLFGAQICAPTLAHAATPASSNTYTDDSVRTYSSRAIDGIRMDTEDPMFFEKMGDFVSRTTGLVGNDVLDLTQRFSYGFNDRFNIAADVEYVKNFNKSDDGFNHVGIMAAYRMSDTGFLSDLYGGAQFTGAAFQPVDTDVVYVVGARMGKQYSWITFAAALQTSWIFHENSGMAYINFMPDVYFRLGSDWSVGAGANLQKATTPSFDQEWAILKLAKRFGHTTYVALGEYEFEHQEWRLGARLNILF